MSLSTVSCCGRRPPGTAGGLLVNACQLCPNSPTYWRDQPASPTPAGQTALRAAPLPQHEDGLDWSKHRIGSPAPCRVCGKPALMRDEYGQPCHKVCAEQAGTAFGRVAS